MNNKMYEEDLAYINNLISDNIRMVGLTFRLVLVPKVTKSRNKREGRYAGMINGHRRWGGGSTNKGIFK
jgi:hypothetical protein